MSFKASGLQVDGSLWPLQVDDDFFSQSVSSGLPSKSVTYISFIVFYFGLIITDHYFTGHVNKKKQRKAHTAF